MATGLPGWLHHNGVIDDQWSSAATTLAVNRTAEAFPGSQPEYVLIPNVAHVPALQASQRLWMEWIPDRFAGHEVTHKVQSNAKHRVIVTSFQNPVK